jgi:transposase
MACMPQAATELILRQAKDDGSLMRNWASPDLTDRGGQVEQETMIGSKTSEMTKTRTGQRYTDQFKLEAVELLDRPGARLREVARGLGVAVVTLRKWRDLARGPALASERAVETDLVAENRRLREQLQSVTAQRDILKKACGILSETPARGTPQ